MALFNFFRKKNENTDDESVKRTLETEIDEGEAVSGEEEEKPQEDDAKIPVYEETAYINDILEEETPKSDKAKPVLEELEEKTEEQEEIAAEEENNKSEMKKQGFFAKIKNGLKKTRNNIMSGVEQVLSGFSEIDDDLYDELEEALIMADIGVDTSVEIINKVREIVKKEKIKEVGLVKNVIIRVISEMLTENEEELELPSPSIALVIGVNGVGKTTTIGKLTSYYKSRGKTVMLAAADTFRAAAIDQLIVWGERNNVQVIKHQENSDPAAVVFDAVAAAKNRGTDILICDTAGRLHNKKNLMAELEKIDRVIARENAEAHKEVFLVLDATTGQNALQQAKLFKEAAEITGIILTKLDGTAKGGIVIAIKNELKIPVRFIGVGEGIEDLRPFNAEEFARALFEE